MIYWVLYITYINKHSLIYHRKHLINEILLKTRVNFRLFGTLQRERSEIPF